MPGGAHLHDRPPWKPITWTDTAVLVMTPAGWRIDDIAYGATWEYGNHGTLRAVLNWAVAEAKKPVD